MNRLKSVLVWVGLLLLAYFSADIIEKGRQLNSLPPYPVLGWLLWLGIVAVLWFLLFQPVIQFARLKGADRMTPEGRARIALRYLERHRRDDCGKSVCSKLAKALKGEGSLGEAMSEFREVDNRRGEAADMVLRHAKLAGLGVVFSRCPLVDGLVLLMAQGRLVVELARLAGYKPSPVFNTLCLGWMATNSMLAALFAQDAAECAGDAFAQTIGDMLGDTNIIGADAVGTKLCSYTVSSLLEALSAGATVYVTGHVFMGLLCLEAPAEGGGTFAHMLKLRRKARAELGREMLLAIPSIAAKAVVNSASEVGSVVGGAVKDAASTVRDAVGGTVNAVGDAVGGAAQATGSAISSAAENIGNAIGRLWKH